MRRIRGPPAAAPVERRRSTVRRAGRRVRPALDRRARARPGTRPRTARPRRRPPACSAAVDVDEPLEVREVGGLVGRGSRPRARVSSVGVTAARRRRSSVSLSTARAYGRPRAACVSSRTVRLVEIRLLEGPNVYRLEPVVKVEVAVGRRRTWYGQREPGRHALVHLGADGPAQRLARRRSRRSSAWIRRLRVGPRRGPRRRRRPSLVGSGPLDRHVPVDRRGTGPRDRRGGARPRRARRARRRARARLTGAQDAAARALERADRARPATTPPTWIRDADRRMPVVSITGTNGKSTVTRLITHILEGRRAARRDDDLRRRARRRAAGRARRLDRARRRAADPARGPTSTSPCSRRRAAGSSCGAWATSRTRRASSRTSRPTTSTSRASTRCPSWPRSSRRSCRITKPDGWVVLNADDPARRGDRAAGAGQRRAVLAATRRRVAAASGAPSPRGGRGLRPARRLARRGSTASRSSTGSSRSTASRSRSAAWPATTSPTRSPRPAAARGLGATLAQVRDGLRRLPAVVGAVAGPAQPVPARVAGRHRRLRPQRGRASRPCSTSPRGSPAARPAGRRRSRRSSARPAIGRTTRCAGIGRIAAPAGAAGRDQGDAASTSAAGRRESVVGEMLAGVAAAGGPPPTCRSTRSETAALRGELGPDDGAPAGCAAGHRADVPRGARGGVRAARRARREAGRRRERAHHARAAPPGAAPPRLSGSARCLSGHAFRPAVRRRPRSADSMLLRHRRAA